MIEFNMIDAFQYVYKNDKGTRISIRSCPWNSEGTYEWAVSKNGKQVAVSEEEFGSPWYAAEDLIVFLEESYGITKTHNLNE